MVKKLALILLCLIGTTALAIAAKPDNEKIYKVGVYLGPPFGQLSASQEYRGVSIDLWKAIARAEGIQYKLIRKTESIKDAINEIKTGKIDVFAGPTSVNSKEIGNILFSRPYFISHTAILYQTTSSNIFHALFTAITETLGIIILLTLLIFVLFAHLFWLLERGKSLNKNYFRGLAGAAWYTFCVFFIGDPSRPNVTTGWARALTALCILIAILGLSSLTAAITSNLTLSMSKSQVKFSRVSDVSGKKIATIKGDDITSQILHWNGIPVRVKTTNEALALLKTGKVQGLADNYYVLIGIQKANPEDHLAVSEANLGYHELAFAVSAKHTALMRKIDIGLAKIQDTYVAQHICEQHLSKSAAILCQL